MAIRPKHAQAHRGRGRLVFGASDRRPNRGVALRDSLRERCGP